MIAGETVVVLRPTTAYDESMDEVTTWVPETVSNVVVAPSEGSDVSGESRRHGTRASLTLHFPKTFEDSLRGCHVVVRGVEMRVVGDPWPYTEGTSPTSWHMPVDVEAVHG